MSLPLSSVGQGGMGRKWHCGCPLPHTPPGPHQDLKLSFWSPIHHYLTLTLAVALSYGRLWEASLLALSTGPLGGVLCPPSPGQASQEL